MTDTFYFARQPLAGNGSLTVRVTSLTGLVESGGNRAGAGQGGVTPAGRATPERTATCISAPVIS